MSDSSTRTNPSQAHKLSKDGYNYEADLAPRLSWKVISTGLSFAIFGLGGLLLSLTVFPLIYITPISRAKRQRISRKLLSHLFKVYVRIMESFGLIKLEVVGAEHLKAQGQLVVANHPSLLDVVYLISLIENTTSIVKSGMWINPFTAGTVLATHYIRNDADDPLADSAQALADDDSLIIFPEGTRTDPSKPFKFQRGAANIALLAKKDITPVTIHSNPPRLLKNQPWYEASKQTLHITLQCHPAISIAPYIEPGAIRSKMARRLTRDLEAFYLQQ